MNTAIFLGCLSPYEVALSIHVSNVAAAFAIGVTLGGLALSSQQRRFDWLPLYVLLVALHPAWIMEANTGDCGYTKRFFSVAASLICAALLLCQTYRPDLSKRRMLLMICAVSWALWIVLFIPRVIHVPIPAPEGFVGEAVQAFVMAGSGIFPVSLALSMICLVWWLVSRFLVGAIRSARSRAN